MTEQDPLEEILARFREIEPPAAVRIANREAIRNASPPKNGARWWQGSVPVPLPVALATVTALVLSLAIHVFDARGHSRLAEPDEVVQPSSAGDRSDATQLVTNELPGDYFETQRYVCGVGVVDRHIYYGTKE